VALRNDARNVVVILPGVPPLPPGRIYDVGTKATVLDDPGPEDAFDRMIKIKVEAPDVQGNQAPIVGLVSRQDLRPLAQ
jgi:hypothetical protein